jgi:hypothetical protein
VNRESDVGVPFNSAQLEFERMDGELDAALVFAVTAAQAGQPHIADATLSDARDCHAKVLAALAKADLSAAQIEHLRAKLLRLRELLGSVAAPTNNVAA